MLTRCRSRSAARFAVAALLALAAPAIPAQCGWSGLGGGTSGPVYAMAVFDDGNGPALYVGGSFANAGGVAVNHVARWDGTSWSALGTGLSGAIGTFYGTQVLAMAVFDDGMGPALYVGGDFTAAGGVPVSCLAKWDGASWSDVGGGVTGSEPGASSTQVAALESWGPWLFVGGSFTQAGAFTGVQNLARWNGATWSSLAPLGAGVTAVTNIGYTPVTALRMHDAGGGPALYIGGSFQLPSQVMVKWQGGLGLTAVGGGGYLGGTTRVTALESFWDGSGNNLYAGTGRVFAGAVERYDSGGWTRVADTNAEVVCMEVFDDGAGPALYMGGAFTSLQPVGGTAIPGRFVRFDGSAWSQVGALNSSSFVAALVVHNDGAGPGLVLGGNFLWAHLSGSTLALNRVAAWLCPGGPSQNPTVRARQAAPGAGVFIENTNLITSHEYYNILSLDLCPGGVGTGPYLGLCFSTQGFGLLVYQLSMPVGPTQNIGSVFHFTANGTSANWGGYPLPLGLAFELVCFDFTGGMLGAYSQAVRYTVQ